MYRLFLVDDEEIVLKGIQKVFDLREFGFETAGVFTNPLRALAVVREEKPDLVITDVRMPQMDGLELTREIKKIDPGIEVVILSGYDDFSYAQTAVKIGASDYLLKPVRKKDFGTMLYNMRGLLDEKRAQADAYRQMIELLENSYNELKNRFYLPLTEGGQYDKGLLEALLRHGHRQLDHEDFILLCIEVQQPAGGGGDYLSELGKLNHAVEDILCGCGEEISFWSDEVLYYILMDFDPERVKETQDAVRALLKEQEESGFKTKVGFSAVHSGLHELFEANNDCRRTIFMENADIDEASDANPVREKEINVAIPYIEIENLFHAISAFDRGEIDTVTGRIYDIPMQEIPIFYKDYFSSITFLILLRGYQVMQKYGALDLVRRELLDLQYVRQHYPEAADQKQLVRRIALEIAETISMQGTASLSRMIRAALAYIDANYSKPISLQDVADNINISKNYLCDVFKKETGFTFVNYVTNLRIEKAKHYLKETDLKMYEVSDAVGYSDYAYFSQIFKKHTGMTLSAYRRSS